MDFAGVIESPPDPPGISKDAWLNLISNREDLVPAEPRVGINPFTGQPITYYPRRDAAALVVNGKEIGCFGWAENDENLVTVFGDLSVIEVFAEQIASALGGAFHPWRGPV